MVSTCKYLGWVFHIRGCEKRETQTHKLRSNPGRKVTAAATPRHTDFGRLRRLHDKLHMTTVLVTHDQEEALAVSDRVVVMNQARIEQVGTPAGVFHNPASEFVMDFLGNVNVFPGRLEQGRAVLNGMTVDVPGLPRHMGRAANVYVRPHELEIRRELHGTPHLAARVVRINPAGSYAKITLTIEDGSEIQVDLPFERYQEINLQPGETVYVSPRKVRVFGPEYII